MHARSDSPGSFAMIHVYVVLGTIALFVLARLVIWILAAL
jgi:hypothetical protein